MKDFFRKLFKRKNGFMYAVPFFSLMAILAIAGMIFPLRPSISLSEKRELTKFPHFTLQSFVSGEYFDQISLWYSDTYPGREQWISLSNDIASLHGTGNIYLSGPIMQTDSIPAPTKSETADTPPETEAAMPETTEETIAETVPETTAETEPTEPPPLDYSFSDSSVIQIGGSGYYSLGFSQQQSDRLARGLSNLADVMAEKGVRVIFAPPPTAIGIEVDPYYLPMLNSADQGEIIGYIADNSSENLITVDTHAALMPHKGEYLFFHTDHHWTADAAYYCYVACCEALGMTPRPLEDFDKMDQGEFHGSISGKVKNPRQLTMDTVYTYDPPGNVYMRIWDGADGDFEGTIIRDMRNQDYSMKYIAFLESDRPLCWIVNDDLPDAKNCVIVKDSFGNCFVPFFSQNYHKVYAIDYRKYAKMDLISFAEKYEIDDIIIAPNMISTQSSTSVPMLQNLCGIRK